MNETLSFFIQTFIIGFSIAAPVGAIGVLCIRRTLSHGKLAGFLSGMGAATADMFYGSLAAFGLTAITNVLVDNAFWLKLVGGLFLLYLGIKTFLEKPPQEKNDDVKVNKASMYFSTFFLTITNPLTILSFLAIFASVFAGQKIISPWLMILGVFAGSATWWFALSFGVGLMRSKLSQTHMVWINRISGIIILLFGVLSLTSLYS